MPTSCVVVGRQLSPSSKPGLGGFAELFANFTLMGSATCQDLVLRGANETAAFSGPQEDPPAVFYVREGEGARRRAVAKVAT